MRRRLLLAILGTSLFMILAADYGPPAGSPMPQFDALDQNGARHTLKDILGPNGAVLVFFRSADW